MLAGMLAGIGSACSLKLTSSIDDVVWLAPFLTRSESRASKLRNAIIYVSVCLIQTLIAMAIARSGDAVVSIITGHMSGAWSTERILTVGAGVLLALYSVKLAFEYFRQGGDDKIEGDVEASNATIGESLNPNSQEVLADSMRDESNRSWSLFTISFLGSLDDLTLFVPMLVGREFDAIQLVVGSFIAASAIMLLCICIGHCRPVARCLSSVPVVLIVSTFAAILLVKGFCLVD